MAYSIENSKIGRELSDLRDTNKLILAWINKYNDLNNSTESLLTDANNIFRKNIIKMDIAGIDELIIFDEYSNDTKIDYIDTSDEIMINAFNIFKKEAVCKNNKSSHIITYIFYYLREYALIKERYVINKSNNILNIIGIQDK